MSQHPVMHQRLPMSEWPNEDKVAWARAISPADIFSDPGPATHLAESTQEAQIGAYGRWLRYVSIHWPDTLRVSGRPDDQECLLAFVKNLQLRLKPVSVWGEIDRLHSFCFYVWPERDWAWMRELTNRLHLLISPRALPLANEFSIDELYQLGLKLMRRSCLIAPYRELDDSVMYRDGLMIALLAVTTFRRKNLWQLSIDQEVKCIGEHWIVQIEAADMKNGQPFEMALPQEVGALIVSYIEEHRARLLGGNDSNKLWISKTGKPMTLNRVGQRIAQVTKRDLGKQISAHMFRHIAATSIATTSPELAHIIRPLLAHTSSRTAERYYNKATSMEASRRVADNIQNLRSHYMET